MTCWPKKKLYKARRKAMERDGYYCQHCGVHRSELDEPLTVHHIKPRLTHPELIADMDNLITLCRPCHKEIETQLFKQCEHEHNGDYVLTEPRLVALCIHCNRLYRVKTLQVDML